MPPLPQALAELRLVLSPEELERTTDVLLGRLREGLAAPGREIAMLPAFVAPPATDTTGEAVAVDAGGTYLRAARVRLRPGEPAELTAEVASVPLPGAAGQDATDAEGFFAAHRTVLGPLRADRLPLGYCFSYPIRSEPDGDAVLERWTKEVRVAGVEGQRVGQMLREHLRAHGSDPDRVVVLNDTIAALVAGSCTAGAEAGRCVGLIVGTGTNMGAFLPTAAIGKLGERWPTASHMAVNFESGAFAPPVLGRADEEVDGTSARPGTQRFEKAVAGAYLGRLFGAASRLLGLGYEPDVSSAEVSRLATTPAAAERHVLGRCLLDRSADLVAAALVATDALLGGEGDLRVCAEGSLCQQAPGYADRVRRTADRLLARRGRSVHVRLLAAPHANLVGSAAAALAAR